MRILQAQEAKFHYNTNVWAGLLAAKFELSVAWNDSNMVINMFEKFHTYI